jgi:hypothetical protein
MKLLLDDRTYHLERAEAELRLAESATDPSIAMVHRQLAALHRRKMLSIVEETAAPPQPRRFSGSVVAGY